MLLEWADLSRSAIIRTVQSQPIAMLRAQDYSQSLIDFLEHVTFRKTHLAATCGFGTAMLIVK